MPVCWHDFAKRRGANRALLVFEDTALNRPSLPEGLAGRDDMRVY
jgi:hypothetical protein